MTVGYSTDKGAIDARAGGLVVQLRNTFEEIARFKGWLDGKTDANLIARGYEQEDVDLLRASFASLAKLERVGRGQDTVPNADNFFFHAKNLTGVN